MRRSLVRAQVEEPRYFIWLAQASKTMTHTEMGAVPIRGFSIVSDHLLTALRLFMLGSRLSTLVLISRQFSTF
jgi:hypothetical protein